jgi:hypothetical protein
VGSSLDVFFFEIIKSEMDSEFLFGCFSLFFLGLSFLSLDFLKLLLGGSFLFLNQGFLIVIKEGIIKFLG